MSYQLIFLVIISFGILFNFRYVSGRRFLHPRRRVQQRPLWSATEHPLLPSRPPVLLKPPPLLKQQFQSVINFGENGFKNLEEKEHLSTDDMYENLEDSSRCERRPTKNWRVAEIEGDILLGGLMNIHELENYTNCSPLVLHDSIHVLECMLFTIDWVNEQDILPGIKLGTYILDSCEDIDGLEQVTYFIKGSTGNSDREKLQNFGKLITFPRKRISGLIEAASSYTSMQVATLLQLYHIPQVRFSSTLARFDQISSSIARFDEINSKIRSKYFFRTMPSDSHQAHAIVEIILKLKWVSVSILYEEPRIQVLTVLENMLLLKNICIAVKYELKEVSEVDEDYFYGITVYLLKEKYGVRGVIILASDKATARVMRAVRRNNFRGMFSWIVNNGGSANSLELDVTKEELEGTISIEYLTHPVPGFYKYFQKLNVYNNKRNPWFTEFWEQYFNCKMPDTNTSTIPDNINFTSTCLGNETISQEKQDEVEEQLQFVSDSVLAFAYAMKAMFDDLCGKTPGLCDKMDPICGQKLSNYMQNVSFKGLSEDKFHFSKDRFGPGRYNVLNFQRRLFGKYKWLQVGEYKDGFLKLNMDKIRFRMNGQKIPESTCVRLCGTGQVKKYIGQCCWQCINCWKYQFLINETTCEDCPGGQLPNTDYTSCKISYWAILSIIIASVGIILTMTVVIVYIKYNDTPVVKASSRELSYVMLGGIFLCYAMAFHIILIPSNFMCGTRNIGIGLCFTIVYSAILTKTNRIDRIFRSAVRSPNVPRFISPMSQLIICCSVISIQVILSATWLVFSPEVVIHHPARQERLFVCFYTHTVMFAYPMILIVICTIYAILTRDMPEAFNESKFILFTMCTTCIIWLAFIPIYVTTTNNIEINLFTMSVTVSLCATVTLFCFFMPKIYIILVHPEKNIRQSLMKQRQRGIQNEHRVIPKKLDRRRVPESSNDANPDSQPESQTTSGMIIQ